MRIPHAACRTVILVAGLALLAACGPVRQQADGDAPVATAPATTLPTVDPVSSREWAMDMARFAAEDEAKPPPARPIVFTGSSSVRLWETLAQDFPGKPVINRGFGGSQVRDAVWYADEIAVRYRPKQILIYSGDNDISADRTPAQVLADVQAFEARIHRDLPGTPIAFIAIKPSPSRANLLDAQRQANTLVRDWAATTRDVTYVDVFTPMLDAAGQPREDLFVGDRLHMNAKGYALWRGIVAPVLVR